MQQASLNGVINQNALATTFAHSAKHIGLYQKFGFRPQHLTPVMTKPVARPAAMAPGSWSTFADVPSHGRAETLAACRSLTDAIYPGLDVTGEIQALSRQRLGDTVLVHEGRELVAFAVCHVGAGSEAGSGAAYVKFGAARPGRLAAQHFERLLQSCEALAGARGMERLVAGVNTARHDAHRMMIAQGFRPLMEGIAMRWPDAPGLHRPDCFVIDDYR